MMQIILRSEEYQENTLKVITTLQYFIQLLFKFMSTKGVKHFQ